MGSTSSEAKSRLCDGCVATLSSMCGFDVIISYRNLRFICMLPFLMLLKRLMTMILVTNVLSHFQLCFGPWGTMDGINYLTVILNSSPSLQCM